MAHITYLPQTIIATTDIEALHTPHLGTVWTLGLGLKIALRL